MNGGIRMDNIDKKSIEDMVRKIIAESLSVEKCEFEKHVDASGIMSVKLNTVKMDKFETGKEGDIYGMALSLSTSSDFQHWGSMVWQCYGVCWNCKYWIHSWNCGLSVSGNCILEFSPDSKSACKNMAYSAW